MLRKVETGVRIPEDSQLTDKDLKAIGKAAAKSLLQECGSVSALSDNSFTEETMKLNLNLQLRPEETVEELLIPEDSQLEVLLSEIQEAAVTKQAS
uniref:Uncharacterized protein n=1 Tax=Knipowitschia caucasica TaxID=637954 RepID=A0AAV2ITI3_KNICA